MGHEQEIHMTLQSGHVGVKTIGRIYMKIEFSSQRREMLLFLYDHKHGRCDVTCKPAMQNAKPRTLYRNDQ